MGQERRTRILILTVKALDLRLTTLYSTLLCVLY